MKKEYITLKTYYKSNNKIDFSFIQDSMDEILSYTTKRFAFLKKNNQLGTYDKKECDTYRNNQLFDNKTILDARYARAIDISIQAKCASLIEVKKLELEAKTIKRKKLQTKFNKAQEYYQNTKILYQNPTDKDHAKNSIKEAYKRLEFTNKHLTKITHKIQYLQFQIDNNIFKNIVFGGRKLFKNQFKQGANFDYFKNKWNNRADEMECGGSAGENFGNKQFQLTFSKTINNKHFFNLQINVPNRLREKYGKTYTLKNIYFPRGQERIKQNVDNHTQYLKDVSLYNNLVRKLKNLNKDVTNIKKPKAEDYHCHSVSFLIKKHKNGKIGIHLSIPRKKNEVVTHDNNGVIGIDINFDNISIAEINKLGKLISSKVYRFNFGKNNSSGYREQMINKHINDIVLYAKSKKKNIVIEDLDFAKKKSNQIKNIEKDYNRMLHTLAYAKIKERIRINCYLEGVVFNIRDAAYSSMLGKTLYAKKYGISTHEAAAYVMARKYYKLEENYNTRKIEILFKGSTCSLMIPADIYAKQVKTKKTTKFWKEIYDWLSKEMKALYQKYQKDKTFMFLDLPADLKYENQK